jgi:hypothetical protein
VRSRRLGLPRSGRPECVVQLFEEAAKRVEVAAAEHAGPVVLDLGDELTRDRLRLSAPRCQANELGASVVRIWDPFDVAEPFEVVDEVDDARLCDLRELRELGHAGSAIGDVLSDRPVSDAKVAESPGSEAFAHQLVDGEDGIAQ